MSLDANLHCKFVQQLEKLDSSNFYYWKTHHMKTNGLFWGLLTTVILSKPDTLDREKILEFLRKCEQPDGGYSGNIGHDSHVLHTLSAIQIFILYKEKHRIDISKICKYVCSLQNDDGSFSGDIWNEKDVKHTFSAIAALYLIDCLEFCNVDKVKSFALSCLNDDGGFGCLPSTESHSGHSFCALAILKLCDHDFFENQQTFEKEKTVSWLCDRKCLTGVNGRPGKNADTCYSWWVLASLEILNATEKMKNKNEIVDYIFSCQNTKMGGFSARPGEDPDLFHTTFSIAGLSILKVEGIQKLIPSLCMPFDLV